MDRISPLAIMLLFSVVVLTFSYFSLWINYKKKYFAIWAVAWTTYILRLLSLFHLTINSRSHYITFISTADQVLSVVSGTLILFGFSTFLNKKISNKWILACSLLSIYLIIISVVHTSISWVWLSLPGSVFAGWTHIWSGIYYSLNKERKAKATIVVSASFIIWGIHTIHYSIDLLFLPSFMPWFYVIDVSLVVIILIGVLLEYFHVEQEQATTIKENYNLLLDNSEEAIVFTRDGKIISANIRAEEISGYTTNELLEKPFIFLLHHEDRDVAIERHIMRQL